MTNNKEIQELNVLLNSLPDMQGSNTKEKVLLEYEKSHLFLSGIAIKILSILGGFFASLAFTGFLAMIGIYDSEVALIFFGGIFILLSVLLNKYVDNILLDTFTISMYAVGVTMIVIGMNLKQSNENLTSLVLILIGLLTVVLNRTYMLTFAATILILGTMMVRILDSGLNNLLHVYLIVLASKLILISFYESYLLTLHPAFSRLMNPFRIGLILSFIGGLFVTKNFLGYDAAMAYPWISSICLLILLVLVLKKMFARLEIKQSSQQWMGGIIAVLIIAPTLITPSIVGALFLVLLSFYSGHKTGLVISSLAFVNFVSQFYYDLSYTLMTKSIILMISGVGFIVMYFFCFRSTENLRASHESQ